MQHYIIGYGSLIEEASRTRTTPNAKIAYPVSVKGFIRGWWARGSARRFTTTYLGCVSTESRAGKSASVDYLNGVIYKVSEEDLKATDQRESSYQRVEVPIALITDYSNILNDETKAWIYVNEIIDVEAHLPDRNYPIVQSYIDICINGCIEIEQRYPEAKEAAFSSHFIRSTLYWSEHWVNDRIYPRRSFIYQPTASKIDRLLGIYLEDPSLLDKIYFE